MKNSKTDHQVSAPHKTNDEHDIGCWLVSLTHLCSMFQALEHMPGSCWKCSVVSRGAPCWEAPAHLDIIVPVKFRSKVHPPRCISQSSSQIAMHCTFPSSLKDVKREGRIQKTGTSTLKHFFSCLKYSQGPQNHSKGVADEWLLEGRAGAEGLALPGWSCEELSTISPGGDRPIQQNLGCTSVC